MIALWCGSSFCLFTQRRLVRVQLPRQALEKSRHKPGRVDSTRARLPVLQWCVSVLSEANDPQCISYSRAVGHEGRSFARRHVLTVDLDGLTKHTLGALGW